MASTLGLLVALIVSRWLAFPATIWDIDEAIFTRALLDFDPAANFPHPPFFPFWILLGKLALWLHPHGAPWRALQLVSSAFSVWMFFPLLALWSLILPRHHAAAATLLFLHLPLPWLLSGRGYTGTAACGLFAACAAHWIRPSGVAPRFWAGATMAACCLLVRPQMAPLIVILAVWRSITARDHPLRWVPMLVPFAAGLFAALAMVTALGGPGPALHVIGRHGRFHFGALSGFSAGWRELAVVRGCGPILWGCTWIGLALTGAVSLSLKPHSRRTAVLIVTTIVLPVTASTLLVSNPTFLRYAVGFYAVTSGFVVAGLAQVTPGSKATVLSLAAGLALVAGATAPHLAEYRHRPAPVVEALHELPPPGGERPRVVADRDLVAFIDLWALQDRIRIAVVWSTELGLSEQFSPEEKVWAVIDTTDRRWLLDGERMAVYSCDDPWLRRFVAPRLLDVTVVEGLSRVERASP